VKKVVDGVTTEYRMAGSLIVSERTGDETIWYQYDSAARLVAMVVGGVRYNYVRNVQNDIIGLIDSAGKRVVSYKYDSWGKTISITGTLAATIGKKNPFRYRGYYFDAESGMYYLQSRYYDVEIRRFISADGIMASVGGNIKGSNVFCYCFSNPIKTLDLSGKWPKSFRAACEATVHTIYGFWRMAKTIAGSIKVEAGVGSGIGGSVSANVGYFPVGVSFMAATTDTASFSLANGLETKITTAASASVSAFDCLSIGYTEGRQHLYGAENCSCSFWHSTYNEKSSCPAQQKFEGEDNTFSLGVEGYLGLGGKIEVSIDLEELSNNLLMIYNDCMEYNRERFD